MWWPFLFLSCCLGCTREHECAEVVAGRATNLPSPAETSLTAIARTALDEFSVVLDTPAEFNRGRVLLMIKAC
jgi:hypothetical protein